MLNSGSVAKVLGMLALAAAALACRPAAASIMGAFDRPNYDVDPGATVEVPVYLDFAGTDAPDLVAAGGLFSAAVKLVRTGQVPTDPACPTAVAANAVDFADILLGPLYVGPSPTEAGVWEFVDLTSPTGVLGDATAGGRRVLLATFTFKAGGIPHEVTTFEIADYDDNLDNTVTFDDPTQALDDLIESASITFTVTPEPATLGLLGLGGLVLLCRRRRGR